MDVSSDQSGPCDNISFRNLIKQLPCTFDVAAFHVRVDERGRNEHILDCPCLDNVGMERLRHGERPELGALLDEGHVECRFDDMGSFRFGLGCV